MAVMVVDPAFEIEINKLEMDDLDKLPLDEIGLIVDVELPIEETGEAILKSSIEYPKSPVLFDVAVIVKSGSPYVFVISGK